MSFLKLTLRLGLLGILGAAWLLAGVYLYLSPNLPDVETLRDVKLQTPMRVYTRDGQLIGQFGEQKRSPLPFDEIPPQFVEALLEEAAQEDLGQPVDRRLLVELGVLQRDRQLAGEDIEDLLVVTREGAVADRALPGRLPRLRLGQQPRRGRVCLRRAAPPV